MRIPTQTIQNWFSFLAKHDFTYNPSVVYERLGLSQSMTLDSAPSNALATEQVVAYDCAVHAPVTVTRSILTVPDQQAVYTPYTIYAPFFRTFDAPFAEDDIAYHWQRCRDYLRHLHAQETCSDVLRDPLLVPVALECARHRSSFSIWQSLKTQFGNDVWRLVRKPKTRSDSIGIKRVQQAMQCFNKPENGLCLGITVRYPPLESRLVRLLIKANHESSHRWVEFVHQIALHSVITTVHPLSASAGWIDTHTTPKGFHDITSQLAAFDMREKRLFIPVRE